MPVSIIYLNFILLTLTSICNRDSENMTAVFDVTNRAVYVSTKNLGQLREFVLPGGDMLLDKLKECVQEGFGAISFTPTVMSAAVSSGGNSSIGTNNTSNNASLQQHQQRLLSNQQRSRPLYDVSTLQKRVTKDVQEYVLGHLMNIIAKTKEHSESLLKLKADRLNGVSVDDDKEDQLFSANFEDGTNKPTEIESNENGPTGVTSVYLPKVPQRSRVSFYNFSTDENDKLPYLNLINQPLNGSDHAFYNRFSTTQV